NWRPQHPTVGGNLFLNEGVTVVGNRQEAAELLLRIVDEHGQQQLTLVGNEDRAIVGDQLGGERETEKRKEKPERPEAAPIGLKVAQPAPIDGRERKPAGRRLVLGGRDRCFGVSGLLQILLKPGVHTQTSRLSKSILGSIQVYVRSEIRFTNRPIREKM